MTWPTERIVTKEGTVTTERIVTKEGTVTTERIVTREGNNIVAERIVITDDDKVVSVERIVSGIMTSRYTTPSSDLRVSPRSYDESPKTTPETRAARMVAAVSWLCPKWFSDEFGMSLLDDLMDVADEYGSRIWWIALTTQLLRIAFTFTLKRFHRRKTRKKNSARSDGW